MGSLEKCRHLAEAHLVQDLAWLFIAEVVHLSALKPRKRSQRGLGELWHERQRLKARQDAVPTELRHEPRETSCRDGRAWQRNGIEAQRREIHQAALIGNAEW